MPSSFVHIDPVQSYTEILDSIIASEGGFANHVSDHGGPTNWGITLKTLQRWRDAPVTLDDVKALSKTEARKIYKEKYFCGPKIDTLPKSLHTIVLDDAVLSGPVAAIKRLQRFLPPATVDGMIGPQTRTLALKAPKPSLRINLVRNRVERYCRIVQTDTSQVVFLVGWVRRAMRFL
jgi:lysozyme family protein